MAVDHGGITSVSSISFGINAYAPKNRVGKNSIASHYLFLVSEIIISYDLVAVPCATLVAPFRRFQRCWFAMLKNTHDAP